MRVLVTGSTGFLGRHLVQRVPGDWSVWAPSSEELDIRDFAQCQRAFQAHAPELCIHLAAQSSQRVAWTSPEHTDQVNRRGTENLARLSKGCRLVYMSTCHVYGLPEFIPITEDHPTHPNGAYAVSKLRGEAAVRTHAADAVILRGFNLIGPGQSTHFAVSDWASQALAGASSISTGNLELRRDYVDVRDAADGILALGTRANGTSVLNLSSSRSVALRTLFELAAPGCKAVVEPSRLRSNDPHEIRGCGKKAVELGWSPKIALDQSVAELVASLSAPS